MNPLALEALTKGQRQLDQDGVEVGVSRQALDELIAAYDETRAKLFPYADATDISGMSWNGFYLIGDSKSITEFRRVEHRAAQLEEYRRAFDERIAVEKARAERAEAALRRLVNAKALSGVREIVAGWNGEGRPGGPFERHRPELGATIPTNCGAVYELDEAMQAIRAALPPAPDARADDPDPVDALLDFIFDDDGPVTDEDRAILEDFRGVFDRPDVLCPICAEPFKVGDRCSTDIEMGACHAGCLEGSPCVDLETGEPVDGPIPTYAYDEEPPAPDAALEEGR